MAAYGSRIWAEITPRNIKISTNKCGSAKINMKCIAHVEDI